MVLTLRNGTLDIAQPTQAQLDALDAQATIYENNQRIIADKKIFIWYLGNLS
jgi:hypothetical protein